MRLNIKLSKLPALHIYLSHIIQVLLHEREVIELDVIESQLTDTCLKSVRVEDSLLRVVLQYNICKTDILDLINMSNVTTGKFFVIIINTLENNSDALLSLDIIYKDSNSLIHKLLDVQDFTLDNTIKKYFQVLMPIIIEPLSEESLSRGVSIQYKYLEPINKYEKITLQASLDKKTHIKVYKKCFIDTMDYWVAKDRITLKIIGLIGIYTEPSDDKKDCWLGWFGLEEEYRSFGYGKELLKFAMQKAQKMGKEYLHLYTYESDEYKAAINLYRQFDFKEYSPKIKKPKDIYMKKYIEKNNNKI